MFVGSHTLIMLDLENNTSHKVKILNEVFLTFSSVIYTRKDFYLVPAFNEIIENLKSSGLIKIWHERSINLKPKIREPDFPQQLRIEHLSGCFEIFGVGLLISLVVFIAECVHFTVQKSNVYTRYAL